MTPPPDALIAWVKDMQAKYAAAAQECRDATGDGEVCEQYDRDADHFAALHARLENKPCIWREEEDGEFWRTDCGQDFVWENGPPHKHGVTFCGHCGHPITEVPYVYADSDDDL